MEISYHHANPGGGNESFLIRVRSGATDSATTVLVDTGAELSLADILHPDETLNAICLTHAHLDHYQSLEQCRQAATSVYASPGTATILDDVLDIAGREYGVEASDETIAAITPSTGWTTVSQLVEFHPVPAGHVPGAVGYLFRVGANDEGTETVHLLATGDFTLNRAGGYSGFPAETIQDVDVLFLTVATNDTFTEELSEGLGIALQQAHSGMQTLVTTSGIFGVQVAYLLDALIVRLGLSLRVRVVGQVAKLYDGLEYDCTHVETVPTFQHTDECLANSTITVAGPEIPRERSAGRLFGVLREKPNACVVQLIGSGKDSLQEGQCATHDFEVVNHPQKEALETVHDSIEPRHTIIVHRHRGAGNEFNEFGSRVWSPTGADEYTLYADGTWRTPSWMGAGVQSQPKTQNVASLISDDILSGLSLPELSRHEQPKLAAEGLDIERIEEILAQEAAYKGPTTSRTPGNASEPDAPTNQETPSSDSITMATDESNEPNEDTTDEKEPPESSNAAPKLVSTTGASFEPIDARIITAIEAGDLSVEDIKTVLARTQQPDDITANGEGEEPHAGSPAGTSEGATDETDNDPAEPEGGDTDDHELEPAITKIPNPDPTRSPNRDTETDEPSRTTVTESEAKFTVRLDPLTTALTAYATRGSDTPAALATVANEATTEYLAARLREAATVPNSRLAELELPPGVTQVLNAVLQTTDEFDTPAELTRAALGSTLTDLLDVDPEVRTPRVDLHVAPSLVDAVIETESSEFETRGDVVTTAIQWYVGMRG